MSKSAQPDRQPCSIQYQDLYFAQSRPGSAIQRMSLSDQLFLPVAKLRNNEFGNPVTYTSTQWQALPEHRRDRQDPR
jgi:hypothetical protein